MNNTEEEIRRWWTTSIIDMSPGKISFRGRAIEEIIGEFSFTDMIWYLVLGTKPNPTQSKLLNAALVAGVDHGPQAPSIATARMAITCGVGLNNAMASAVNMLGDVHGGAGEQCASLFYRIAEQKGKIKNLNDTITTVLKEWQAEHGDIVSGYGHRFHKPSDPRSPKLLSLIEESNDPVVDKQFVTIGREIEKKLTSEKGKPIPMNIDGATATIFCSLGIPAPLARGLFCLSRSVGILAHAWEQMNQGGRNKGPLPPQYLPWYEGNKKND